MKYEDCQKDMPAVLRYERDVLVQIKSKYKWSGPKGVKGLVVTVVTEKGTLLDCHPARLMTLSEAQNTPLKPQNPLDVRPPRYRDRKA